MQVLHLHGHRRPGQRAGDALGQRVVHLGIQQHEGAVAQQPLGPYAHQHGADDAHQWVQPAGPPPFAAKQGQNGQNGGGRVGQHVDVGGAQVQVGVGAMRVLIVSMAGRMRVGMVVVAVPMVGAVGMGIGSVVRMMIMVVRCLSG